MCMGKIPEGRVRSMGSSHMGKVMSDYFKISGPDRGPDCNILFSTFFGVKISFLL